jgi:succinoglycan biosynthesis protein ExoV
VKLYHCPIPNFGDALNTWLWPQVLPGIFDEDESTRFVGIGTLLNVGDLPSAPYKVVFGSGAGYGKRASILDRKWRLYCVRGPLTAQALGVAPELAITDAAVLMRLVDLPPAPAKTYPVSYMPHWSSLKHWDWERLCQEAGIHFIDPNGATMTVLDEIRRSEVVLAEAMHAAITADALRVPWIPVRAYQRILPFKWQDWCLSLDLDYQPHYLPALYSAQSVDGKLTRSCPAVSENKILAPVFNLGKSGVCGLFDRFNAARQGRAVDSLKWLAVNASPLLSTDKKIAEVTERLQEKLEAFKDDFAAGTIFSGGSADSGER